jgi:hypothetical protein
VYIGDIKRVVKQLGDVYWLYVTKFDTLLTLNAESCYIISLVRDAINCIIVSAAFCELFVIVNLC